MRRALTLLSMLAWAMGPAWAQTSPSPPSTPKAPGSTASPSTPGGANPSARSRETRTGKNPVNESLASCLAMWERTTHMSKQEWGRACRRVDDRLRNLVVK